MIPLFNMFRNLLTPSAPISSQVSGAPEGATPIPVVPVGHVPPKPSFAKAPTIPPAWDTAIRFVALEEGGYVNHPRDPGRCTNHGITLATLRRWREDDTLNCNDVRALTPLEAREILRANYWNVVRGDDLPRGIGLCAFDFGVNAGPRRAAIELQQVLKMNLVDGVIGPATTRVVWGSQDYRSVVIRYCDARIEFYKSLPTWDAFGKGWTARTERCRAEALSLVATARSA